MLNDFLASSATWGVMLTLCTYAFGMWLNRKTGKAIFNPLLIASIAVILVLQFYRIPYTVYKASAAPVSYLVLPATVSLAIPLYEKWELLKKNALAILAGIFAGVLASLGSILVLAMLFKLDRAYTVTLLPKSVTTAIGMDIAAELGGIPVLTSAVIILTGIMGNLTAESVCKWFRITDPTARGIAIGTSSHAVGTAKAMQMGQTEGAMSGLAIAVAGLLTAALAPFAAALIP